RVASAVAEEDNILESLALEARRHIADNGTEGVVAEIQAAPFEVLVLRVAGLDRDDGSDERIAKLAGDRFSGLSQRDLMLRRDEIGPVLFGASGEDQRRRLAGLHRVANLEVRELLDPDAVDRRDRPCGGPFLFISLAGSRLALLRSPLLLLL